MEISEVTLRRLLLAKELFLHGLDHSSALGGIDKMIAVHNFHNSIEVTLRAIMLHYEIRSERQMNIDFETMLKEIDEHPALKEKMIKLPYRNDLRTLNTQRNLVQHHASEPATTVMEDYRVFTRRFLTHVYHQYFGVGFDMVSSSTLVRNESLQRLLKTAENLVATGCWNRSLPLIRAAYDLAFASVAPKLQDDHFDRHTLLNECGDERLLKYVAGKLLDRIRAVELGATLEAGGILKPDLIRFRSSCPSVLFTLNGAPHITYRREYDEECARWSLVFVTRCIINWQYQGLNPRVIERSMTGGARLIEESLMAPGQITGDSSVE